MKDIKLYTKEGSDGRKGGREIRGVYARVT